MNQNKLLKVCKRCIMDNSANDIIFNNDGTCSYCTAYLEYARHIFVPLQERQQQKNELITKIKEWGKNLEYDCIIGISGGADSSYVAYLVKKHGLRALAVHLDNGWNSELAVQNIQSVVQGLDIELYTQVINWREFRDVQKAYFKSGVLDLEVPTDHAIGVTIQRLAHKYKIKYFLSGTNLATEAMMPHDWFFDNKLDSINFNVIQKKFGQISRLKSFPHFSTYEYFKYLFSNKVSTISFLNYFDYNKNEAIQILQKELKYKPYPVKHYESIFTRFYQGYILPIKFGIDKRKPFLSTMIMNGQITREEALHQISNPSYDQDLLREDKEFVLKKLGFSEMEFTSYMSQPIVDHLHYPSITKWQNILRNSMKYLKNRIL